MLSRHTKRIAQLFGFLVLSVGILFMVMLILGQCSGPVEGFQTVPAPATTIAQATSPPPQCIKRFISNQPVWLCSTATIAQNMYSLEYSTLVGTSPVCYLTVSSNALGVGNFFTCFQSVAPWEYDDRGIRIQKDPVDRQDPTPDILRGTVDFTCTAYRRIGKIVPGIQQTIVSTLSSINGNVGDFTYAKTEFMRMSNDYCDPRANDPFANVRTTICSELGTIITTLSNYEIDPEITGVRTTIREVGSNLRRLHNEEIIPSFRGTNCDSNGAFVPIPPF